MSNNTRSDLGMISPEAIAKFRSMLKKHEIYTDRELANTLSFLGSMEPLFSGLPPYLPPIVRASVVANEFGPSIMAALIDAGAVDPIAMVTFIESLAKKMGAEDDGPKPRMN